MGWRHTDRPRDLDIEAPSLIAEIIGQPQGSRALGQSLKMNYHPELCDKIKLKIQLRLSDHNKYSNIFEQFDYFSTNIFRLY